MRNIIIMFLIYYIQTDSKRKVKSGPKAGDSYYLIENLKLNSPSHTTEGKRDQAQIFCSLSGCGE
jgi:hypothetical protein